jgi:hypothetical protein
MKKFLAVLMDIKNWIKTILSVSKNYAISLVVILLIYVMFWHLPQIKDLLVTINQEDRHFLQMGLFFSALTVLAFIISNLYDILNNFDPTDDSDKIVLTNKKDASSSSKFVSIKKIARISDDAKETYLYENDYNPDLVYEETQEHYIKRMLPKVLGTLLIVVTAFAINHTYNELTGKYIIFNEISFFKSKSSTGFYFTLFLLLISLSQKVSNFIKRTQKIFDKNGYFPMVLVLLSFGYIVYLGLFNRQGADEDIENLFSAVLLLAFLFFLISTSYNKQILKLKSKVGIYFTIGLTIVVLISYFWFFFSPQTTNIINPLSIILINLITIVTIISLFQLYGKIRGKSILARVLVILIILGTITASKKNFKHYEVSTVKADIKVDSRLELNTYIEQWLDERRPMITALKPSEKFPVIFVSAEGGGSRAGLWSFLIHSYLYDNHPEYFNQYLFSLTGASGGGVGNAMFYTTAHQYYINKEPLEFTHANTEKALKIFKYKASTIYKGNYISSSIAALMGRDFIKSIDVLGMLKYKDRGKLVEDEWEKNYSKEFNLKNSKFIAGQYLSIMPQFKGKDQVMPLLMMNTTHLQTGNRAIISPVKFTKNKHMKGFRDFLRNYRDSVNNGEAIKVSTSMLLNARFPYLSPVGKVRNIGQFGDAGYYDNIGGSVTRSLENAFRAVLNDSVYDDLRAKIDIRHLIIANKEAVDEKAVKKALNTTQLTAPLKMILGATFAHPNEFKDSYPDFLIESKRTDVITENDTIKPILPLGRILSKSAILSLENRLDSVKYKLDKLVQK